MAFEDFTGALGEYVGNQMDRAMQPFRDPKSYFDNLSQANVRPVSTTINHNEDGTHSVTQKHHVTPAVPTTDQDLQGAMSMDAGPAPVPSITNAQAPMVQNQIAMPAMPQFGPPVQVAANTPQLPQTQPPPQAMAVSPDQTAAEIQRLQQQATMAQGTPVGAVPTPAMNPQAQTVITSAGDIRSSPVPVQQQAGAPVQAVNPNAPPSEAQLAQQMAQAQDMEGGFSQQAKIKGTPEYYHDQLVGVETETNPLAKRQKYAELLADPTISEDNKKLVHGQLAKNYEQEKRLSDAFKAVDKYSENDLTRAIKNRDKDGSYIKYVIASHLGLKAMAQTEAAKLGLGNVVTSETIGDQRFRVERNLNNEVVSAHDVHGKEASPDVLAQISAESFSMKGATPASSMFKDPNGNLWSHTGIPGTTKTVWTNQKTGVSQSTAPEGLIPAGQVPLVNKANIAILQNKIKKMESDNVEAARTGSTAVHSVAEIDALKEAIQAGGGALPATEAPAKAASTAAPAANVVAPAAGKPTTEIDGQSTSAKAPANNNPSNIIDSTFARKNGATNTGPIGSQGRFANFPDVNVGEQAQHNLLINPTYSKLPLRDIPKVWAPKGDGANDPAAYANSLQKITKFDDTTMGKSYLELTPEEQQTFRDAQRQIEHGAGISGGKVEKTTTGVWATPEANAVANRNPSAASIARYESAPPSATGRNSAGSAALMNDVRRINPDYNDQKYKTAQVVRNDYAKVNPASAGGQLQAVNRAIPHLSQYEEAVKALNNGNMPVVNSILQQFNYNVGNDKVAAARAIQGLVSTEVMKAVAGGLGGVEERQDLKAQLGTNLSDKQLARVIHEYQGLMVEQGRGLKQNWTANGLPGKEWDTKLVPKARAVFDQHDRQDKNPRSKW